MKVRLINQYHQTITEPISLAHILLSTMTTITFIHLIYIIYLVLCVNYIEERITKLHSL